MDKLKKKISRIIRKQFLDADVQLEKLPLAEKLSGRVVAQEFSGMTQRERSKVLRDLLNSQLNETEQRSLSALLTLSPAEYRAHVEFG